MPLKNQLSTQEKKDFNKDGFIFKRCLFNKKEMVNIMKSLEGDPLIQKNLFNREDDDGNKTISVQWNHPGNSSYGVGARIQNVFEELNLTNWEGTIIAPVDDNCIKVDGDCYTKSSSTLVRPTHRTIDEKFDDCNKCTND